MVVYSGSKFSCFVIRAQVSQEPQPSVAREHPPLWRCYGGNEADFCLIRPSERKKMKNILINASERLVCGHAVTIFKNDVFNQSDET